MLQQERINSSAIERHERLDQVIAVDRCVMVGGCKFAKCSYPELVLVTELPIILGCNPLELCVGFRGEYRLQELRQVGSTTQEQVKDSLSIRARRLRGQLVLGSKGRHRLGSSALHPERLMGFETPEQSPHSLADCGNDVCSCARERVHLGTQEGLATAKARRNRSDRHPSLRRCAHGLFPPH